MKTLFKIFLVLFGISLALAGAGLFILTRPGVQKKIVESQLPEGSSIRAVRVTTGSLELSELKLALPDGTQVRLDTFETDFKPLAVLFDDTVKIGALNVNGLMVEIPTALIQGPTPSDPSVSRPGKPQDTEPLPDDGSLPTEAPAAAGSPADALYAIGQLDWLIDIDSIQLDGELRDAAGSRYAMDLRSGAIRPGEETTIEASLKLSAGEALHAGLKEFDASARVFLKQKSSGGFEQLRVESLTNATDQNGNKLLSLSQELDVSVQGFKESAVLTAQFNADLPRPGIFLPGLTGVGPVNVEGSLAAGATGDVLTLSETDLLLSAAGADLIAVKLNKQFTLGGQQDLRGNLMDLRVTNLPLAWLAPWLPAGIALSGEDLSAQFNLTGQAGGALELSLIEPLRVGPISLTQDGAPLLNQVTIVAQPVIRLAADQSIDWDLGELQILDRYGEILSANSTGRFDPSLATEGFFPAGLQTETRLDIGLQEITQQPALAAYTSIMAGRASLDLKVAPTDKHPLQVQGRMEGLSPRAYPGQRQDYRYALQLHEPQPGQLALGASLQAGSENRPSSNLQFAGQALPGSTPMEFKADLTAQRLSQRDIEFLQAAFQPQSSGDSSDELTAPPVSPPKTGAPQPQGQAAVEANAGPFWAGYDGEVNITIAELVLLSGKVISDLSAKAVISEPRFSLKELDGTLEKGKVSLSGEVRFSQLQRMAYLIQGQLDVKDMDPALFSGKSGGTPPVQGLFDGQAQVSGRGATLDQAVDDLAGDITVTGREGVLTAFKFDELLPASFKGLGELGRIGIGLLGEQVDRPGITALAQAVPYFENMPFSEFTLKLSRGADKQIKIPELRFIGRNLLIDGSGSIAASSLKDALQQPLDLSLELGAKGQLTEHLKTLELLGGNTTEDGFRRWDKTVRIKGTLSDPDASALENLLKQAANKALSESSKKRGKTPAEADTAGEPAAAGEAAAGEESPRKPSKEEKIIRDVGAGLNLLFGE